MNMLSALDQAADGGVKYNSVVLRKAFKSLIFEDVKLCNWESLASTTFETIHQRCSVPTDDPVDFHNFLHVCCSQQLMRLGKNTGVKSKETSLLCVFWFQFKF